MHKNNTSNQTSVLDNVFSGFPNLFGSPNSGASRNTAQNGCESKAPIPNYYSPYTPRTNKIYLSQTAIGSENLSQTNEKIGIIKKMEIKMI